MATRHPATKGGHTGIVQYELVDTVTGASQVLLDAPIPTNGSEMAWSADSKSVVVSDVYLPLDVDDPAERALRKAHTFLVEFKIPSREFVKISEEDLRLLNWDPQDRPILPAMLAGSIASPERLRRRLIFERAARRGLEPMPRNKQRCRPCRISFSMRA